MKNKHYPKWQLDDTRRAADLMDDAQLALCEARAKWEANGKPDTVANREESKRLQHALAVASEAFSKLSRRDLSAFLNSKKAAI
jgi:hypothetical protein